MARNRMISLEFWESETLADVSRDARLMFIGLWNQSDDYGVCQRNSRMIQGNLFPFDADVTVKKIDNWINELVTVGVIREFEYKRKKLIFIKGFTEHQVINRPSKRRYVEVDDYKKLIKGSLNTHETLSECSSTIHGSLIDEIELEVETETELKTQTKRKTYTIDSKPYELLSASEQKERDSFLNASNYLYNAIVEHGKVTKVMKPESAKWLREFRLLKEGSSDSWEDISNVLKGYCANMDDKYMPQAYGAESFRAKYDKIREKLKKDKKEEETTQWKV